MAEYIEREKAWRKVNKAKNIEEALNFIDSIPTADVVEVVRCKDCGMSRETEDERYLFCMQFADTVDFQAFCSYGERKCDNG
jgi:hypothetical protein